MLMDEELDIGEMQGGANYYTVTLGVVHRRCILVLPSATNMPAVQSYCSQLINVPSLTNMLSLLAASRVVSV